MNSTIWRKPRPAHVVVAEAVREGLLRAEQADVFLSAAGGGEAARQRAVRDVFPDSVMTLWGAPQGLQLFAAEYAAIRWAGYPWGWVPCEGTIVSWACSACIEAEHVQPGHKRCRESGYRLFERDGKVYAFRPMRTDRLGESPAAYEVLEVIGEQLTDRGWEALVMGQLFDDVVELVDGLGDELVHELLGTGEYKRQLTLVARR